MWLSMLCLVTEDDRLKIEKPYQVVSHYKITIIVIVVIVGELLRRTIVIRTCDQHKNLYILRIFETIFGPDYYVPR